MVSIRRSLLTNLIAVVALLGLAILAMTFVVGGRSRAGFAQVLIDQTLTRTEVQLDGFFAPVGHQLQMLAGWARDGSLNARDSGATNSVFEQVIRAYPWVTSVMLADSDGHEHMLLRAGDHWRNRRTFEPGTPQLAVWSEWSGHDRSPVVSEEAIDYDPRARPWYQGAVAMLDAAAGGEPAVFWTEPYTFFTAQEPGITAAVALRDAEGELIVLGLDVLLLDISRFTTAIDVSGQGAAFVLADDGRLVGMPRGPRFPDDASLAQALLKRPEELGTPVARDLSAALLGDSSGPSAVRFDSDGGAWWGQLRPYPLSPERQLLIGVAVPESDLLAEVRGWRGWIAVLTLVAVALAIGRAVSLAGRYSRPVEALVAESERMSTGDLEPGPSIDTEVAEVHHLASALERMRQGLATLLRVEHDLKIARRIQEGTYPDSLPVLDGFDLAAWSEPAEETGGDTYDVIGIRGASIGDRIVLADAEAGGAVLLLADATGHGIGPALSVTQVRAMLRVAVRLSVDLSEIVTHINAQLCADLPPARFVTCWLGQVTADGSMRSVSAGQAPLLHYHAARDEFGVLKADTLPLGLFDRGKIEVPEPIELQPGDIYAVLSDGIFEAAAPDEEQFGDERVQAILREYRDASAAEMLQQIRDQTEEFTQGAPADDDRTIILIKRNRADQAQPS